MSAPFQDRYPTTRRMECDNHIKPYEYTQTYWRGKWTPESCPECEYAEKTAALNKNAEKGLGA